MTCEKPYLTSICVRLFHRAQESLLSEQKCFPVQTKTFSAHVKSKNEHDVREKRFNAHAILRNFLYAAIEKLHRQGARTDRHP